MRVLLVSIGLLGVACGSDDSCESSDPDLCGGGAGTGGFGNASILGANAASYDEIAETTNGDRDTPELSGYTLEAAEGIALHGTFEATAPTSDTFQFNSGTFGGATAPDFPGALIQVLIDGRVLDAGISLSLDTVNDHGYSSLRGSYFNNAALFSDDDYLLSITPGATVAGKSYTIELRGKSE